MHLSLKNDELWYEVKEPSLQGAAVLKPSIFDPAAFMLSLRTISDRDEEGRSNISLVCRVFEPRDVRRRRRRRLMRSRRGMGGSFRNAPLRGFAVAVRLFQELKLYDALVQPAENGSSGKEVSKAVSCDNCRPAANSRRSTSVCAHHFTISKWVPYQTPRISTMTRPAAGRNRPR